MCAPLQGNQLISPPEQKRREGKGEGTTFNKAERPSVKEAKHGNKE